MALALAACQTSEFRPTQLKKHDCRAVLNWAKQNQERAIVFQWYHSPDSISFYASMRGDCGPERDICDLNEADRQLYDEIAYRTHYVTLRDFGSSIVNCLGPSDRGVETIDDAPEILFKRVRRPDFEADVFWSEDRCFPDGQRLDRHYQGCLSVSVRRSTQE